ncbi:hypothetical protein [Pyruvatibacter sp.]|uniref:hypothetical protein n=1 Tax=Pyruvatibacter sp. TaxID=1981328 RepID=UPI0032ECE396
MKNMLLAGLQFLFRIGPILFGLAFLAPVSAELMTLAGIIQPFGMPSIYVGLIIGLSWGSYALLRGRWI